MESSPLRNRLLLVAAAILFSTGGAAIKAASFTGWQVASFRSAVAAVALLLVVPDARRGWSWRIAPVGAAYAATLILFVLATRLTTAANALPTAGSKTRGVDSTPVHGWQAKAPAPPCSDFLTNTRYSACRTPVAVTTCRKWRRQECRRGTHECVRHVITLAETIDPGN